MIALDPTQTTTFCLEADLQKPENDRPTFVTRFLTAAQVIRQEEMMGRVAGAKSDAEAASILIEAISLGLTGVRNFPGLPKSSNGPVPLPANVMLESMTFGELHECVIEMRRATTLSELDRKKSASPSRSDSPAATDASGPGSHA